MQLSVIEEATGRPTLLDERMASQICDAIATGLNNQDVADLCSISYETLRAWSQNPEFAKRIAAAKAFRKLSWLKRIAEGQDGWQGTCWIVQRHYAQEWGNHLLYQRAESGEKNITPDEASLIKSLSNYHALKNGQRKEEPTEVAGEVQRSDSEPG
jgi:hypothetical protein